MSKFFFAPIAVLALATINLHADTFDISLKTGTTVDALTETNVTFDGVAAKQYTYVNETVGTLGAFGAVLSSSTSTFTATYAALSPTASLLNVTDVCASVYLLGNAPGCQGFSFSFSNVKLGSGDDGVATASLLLNASANVGVGFADLGINGDDVQGINIAGLSIGSGSGDFNFGEPAPTPEPSSLCLMATGLVAAAGGVRRRYASSKV